MDEMRTSRIVAEVAAGQHDRVVARLAAAGAAFREFRRRARPSPVAGRPDLRAELFPGHLFIAEDDLPAEGIAGLRPFRTDKGRPLCLPPHVMGALEAYCALGPGADVPPHLSPLDVLGARERLWFVLETWPRWPGDPARSEALPPEAARSEAAYPDCVHPDPALAGPPDTQTAMAAPMPGIDNRTAPGRGPGSALGPGRAPGQVPD